MLSCNEGDAGLAAEVREKMPHSRPVLNTFEHFVLGFHRGLRLVRFETRDVLRRPHSRAAWFFKKEKKKGEA